MRPQEPADAGAPAAAAGPHDAESHAGHLAHHFDNPAQQLNASKLGMWIFLGTELLMFGGLFTAYAIYRGNHPEIFRWASVLLDQRLGAINTLVLITSSLTMALAVGAAQRGQRGRLVTLLGLTFLGACGFLGIKAMEYRPKFEHGLLWGSRYDPDPEYIAHHYGVEAGHAPGHGAPKAAAAVDLERGRKILTETCASCHGKNLRGLPNNGVDLVASEFVGRKSEEELVAFLKVGRQPFDPENRTKIQMPPRGGNPTLNDDMLRDTAAALKEVWLGPEAAVALAAAGTAPDSAAAAAAAEEEIPRSVMPPGAAAPSGLASAVSAPPPSVPAPPPNVHHFFAIYFLMTGLHAIHVIAGMCVIGWLIVGAVRGRFGPGYYTPVDLGGLFWHLVDLIWIFLFPLFYLI